VLGVVESDYLCYLYPVAPLLTVGYLRAGWKYVQARSGWVAYLTDWDGGDAGAFYWMQRDLFLSLPDKDWYQRRFWGICGGELEGLDVNTEEDWETLEGRYRVREGL